MSLILQETRIQLTGQTLEQLPSEHSDITLGGESLQPQKIKLARPFNQVVTPTTSEPVVYTLVTEVRTVN